MKKETKSVYEIITETVVDMIEKKGVLPWQIPWNTTTEAMNYKSKKEYRGVNAFLTRMSVFANGYSNSCFLTFNQVKELGGMVKKGSKSLPIVFWNFLEKTERDETGKLCKKVIPLVRYYNVFNLDQIDGIEWKLPKSETFCNTPIASCEYIVAGFKNAPEYSFGGDKAFYAPAFDKIRIPVKEQFAKIENFYSTLFHEFAHSTGHKSRLNRDGVANIQAFGSVDYGKEELIAEMTAAFLCAKAGIENETINQSAAYLANWLRAIKANPKLLIESSSSAQKASDYILGVVTKGKDEE
jgi:antirestriction protein ArdC